MSQTNPGVPAGAAQDKHRAGGRNLAPLSYIRLPPLWSPLEKLPNPQHTVSRRHFASRQRPEINQIKRETSTFSSFVGSLENNNRLHTITTSRPERPRGGGPLRTIQNQSCSWWISSGSAAGTCCWVVITGCYYEASLINLQKWVSGESADEGRRRSSPFPLGRYKDGVSTQTCDYWSLNP